MVDGQYKTLDEVKDNRSRSVYDHHFAATTTDRIRINITDVNPCLFEKIEWIPKISSLRAVEVFAEPAGQASCFFIPDALRIRIVAPGGSVPVQLLIKNIRDQKLDAQIRLTLPGGLSAESVAVPVAIDPNGEIELTVTLKLAPDAPKDFSQPSPASIRTTSLSPPARLLG